MKEDYTDIIEQVSQMVFEAIKDREENLPRQVKDLDGELAQLLRLVGLQVMSMCLNEAAETVTNKAKKKGDSGSPSRKSQIFGNFRSCRSEVPLFMA